MHPIESFHLCRWVKSNLIWTLSKSLGSVGGGILPVPEMTFRMRLAICSLLICITTPPPWTISKWFSIIHPVSWAFFRNELSSSYEYMDVWQCRPKPFGGPKQNLIWGPPPTTAESPVHYIINCINTVIDYELLSPWAQMHKDLNLLLLFFSSGPQTAA